ncbi:MAG: fasciclin domain-containing protein [Xanthomonadales bacterium]|jgi:uncharacterized surface protein with fasciclin (FAS1) repeats|nr:fasciclin domain-containing protein [Xanthomonadales bacterium]
MKRFAPRITGTAQRLWVLSLVSLALLGGTTAQAGHHQEHGASMNTAGQTAGNIVETAAAAGQFETLIAAARAAGLAGALTGEGPLTVFAPTDEAFDALPAGTVETLLKPENRDQLARILQYHVLSGRVGSDQLADGVSVDTLAGEKARITATEGGFAIEGARITATDIDASNGVVHVIDRVILPPERAAKVSRVSPDELISMAINQGAPQFNHGNHEATLALYMVTAQALMSFAGLEPSQEQRLARGIMNARAAGSPGRGAWELRYALDDVSASLGEERRVASR